MSTTPGGKVYIWGTLLDSGNPNLACVLVNGERFFVSPECLVPVPVADIPAEAEPDGWICQYDDGMIGGTFDTEAEAIEHAKGALGPGQSIAVFALHLALTVRSVQTVTVTREVTP